LSHASIADDAPAVVIEYDAAYPYDSGDTTDSAWHGCYGSPPARLERMPAVT
jgi:hypothetical protein